VHIPDGFLDIVTIIVTYAIFIMYLAYSLLKAKGISADKISLATVLAAGIFATQMLNWPLPGGTSLHFVGGALAGILLGPWLGFLTMFLVLFIQCIVFHDGGITALGANVLNMGIIGVLVGYYIFTVTNKVVREARKARIIGAFLGGWISVIVAGIACGLEIGFSPACPYGVCVTVPVMGSWHAVLGVIEGIITALVVDYIALKAPHIIQGVGVVHK